MRPDQRACGSLQSQFVEWSVSSSAASGRADGEIQSPVVQERLALVGQNSK